MVDPAASPLLVVRGASRKGQFENIDLTVRPGEIVGLGLVGQGSELAHIYGAAPLDQGDISIDNAAERLRQRRRAGDGAGAGIPALSGPFMGRSIRENISLPYLDRFMGWLGLRGNQERERVAHSGKHGAQWRPRRPGQPLWG